MNRRLLVVLILTAEALVGSATGVQRTTLSTLMKGYGGFLALLPILSFGVFKATADVAAGLLAHRRGRKWVFVLGAAVYLLGVALILYLKPPTSFIAGNTLVGMGEGIVFATAAVALSDVLGSQASSRSFGFMEGFAYMGYATGAFLGGLLWQLYGPMSSFTYAAAAAAAALAFTLVVSETRSLLEEEERFRYEPPVEAGAALKGLMRNPSVLAAMVAAHVAKVGDTLAWALIPLLLLERGIGSVGVGLVQSTMILVWALLMPLWSEISDRIGRRVLATLGLLVNAGAVMLFPSLRGFQEFLLLTMVMGVSYAMYYPVLPAPMVDVTPLKVKDIAVGIYRGVRDSGYATGALLTGLLISQRSIAEPFVDVGVLLAVVGALFSLVFRETRPAWPFFDLVVKHAEVMRDVIEAEEDVIKAVFSGRVGEAEEHLARIKDLERAGDQLKREIMGRIWSSFLPISDRMDFERLVEELDRVAGAVLECDERLVRVEASPILGRVEELMLEMNREILGLAEMFIENLKALKKSPLYAVGLSIEVERGESRVDRIRRELLDEIRALIRRGDIDLLTAIDLRDSVDLLEMVADDFEDASDIIRIIAYKHAATPFATF